MFKDRFGFRRKTSKDAPIEAHERPPLPPPYTSSDGIITGSPHDPTVQRSLRADSAYSGIQRERSRSPSDLRDPLGLHILHNPEGGRKVDIIFVHGLGGTSRLTWSKNKDLNLFWPLKFLPFEPDICQGRIMTFGYNGSFFKANVRNSATVLDFAKDLLYDLKYAKDEHREELNMGTVPIIFLVHSMGGLIVKEAYMQGQYDPEYKDIIDAISAIIFLSTPHRGTNLAETLNRILQASLISSSKQFISELTQNSFTLQKLNEQFRHVAPKLDIVSFYETQMTPIGINKNKIMVLERDSSVLGYPGEISRALDADHHGVCKFESPEDPLYVVVRNVLKSLVSKVPMPGSDNISVPTKRDDLREIQILLAVSQQPDVDYIFFRDRWMPNTCGWVLGESVFSDWMQDITARPRVLWLHGPAASGKSVLSSFIINHLAQLGVSCQYFFVRFGDQSKQSLSMLLRALAYQLAQSLPSFRHGLVRIIEEVTKVDTADAQTIWLRIFKSVFFKIRLAAPVYWVIDGLEESEDPRSLIKLVSEVDIANSPVRILVVSRKTQGLLSSFQKLARNVHLDIIPYEGSLIDVQHFIDQELEVSGDEGFQNYVKREILQRAGGNFLWVHLAIRKINDCHTAANVEQALRQLPSGMEALYDRMAHSVAVLPQQENKRLATSILAWVTCALRCLTIEELSLALEDQGSIPLDLQRSIGELCGGFVVVDNGGYIVMIHQTACEYLTSDAERPFKIDRLAAHEQLLMRCMHCLTDLGLRSKINRRQAPAFLEYAATSWFHHLSRCSVTSEGVVATLRRFFRASSVLTWIQALAQANHLRTLISASTQLSIFIRKRKEINADRNEPQDAFFESWATDLVKVVGKFGTNLARSPESIYKLIPPFCPDESVMYQQFGKKEDMALKVSGSSLSTWDDSLARLSFGPGIHATSIKAAGNRIAVLSPSGVVILYYASTCEEIRRIKHGERVLRMQFNLAGTSLVTYGYKTSKVWEVGTGRCTASVENPSDRPRPHTIVFGADAEQILVGTDDRRIRSLALGDHPPAWHVVAEIDEQALEGTVVNSPTCMALSPDGNTVAFGYRGHPLSVWEVPGPELVGHCLRVFNDSTQSNAAHAWGEVVQLTWHPYTGEVIGLYLEGVVFRWHPYHDETKELHAGANSFVVSQDAKCLATGDPNGIIKLFSMMDFSIVYQFASQDPVFGLAFAPDSHRLYDVRGSYCNVWEPNALLRLSEAGEGSSDSSRSSSELVLKNVSSKIDPVTALAPQPGGRVYCSGTESGVIKIFETSRTNVVELRRSKSFMSIEHVVWSDDGEHVGFSDLSGRVFVRYVQQSDSGVGSWTIEDKLDIPIDVSEGTIRQLLFHPNSSALLVYTVSTLNTVSLQTKSILASQKLPDTSTTYKWINHPSHQDSLLAFAPGHVHIWAWSNLIQTTTATFPSQTVANPNSPTRTLTSSSTNPWEPKERIEQVLTTPNNTFILLQSSRPINKSSQKQTETLLLPVSAIPTSKPQPQPHPPTTIHPFPLPNPLTSTITHPLALLSRSRLIFLNPHSWLCSWRLPLPLPTPTPPSRTAGGALDASTAEIKPHYFFPSDWLSPESVRLCAVMADGTVLCPRNGEVALVRCAGLR